MKRIAITVELADGTKHDLQVANPSLVAWDRTRSTRKWATVDEAPNLWMTFIAWHHMKSRGLVTCEYPEFEEKVCLAVGDTVKPLTDDEKVRLAELELTDKPLSKEEKDELEKLQTRREESEAEVDPTPPALEPVSSSS